MRFVGEPIAVVVASDRYVAEDAAELVAVEYDDLGAVTAARAALEPDAPLLHEDAGSNVATDRTILHPTDYAVNLGLTAVDDIDRPACAIRSVEVDRRALPHVEG